MGEHAESLGAGREPATGLAAMSGGDGGRGIGAFCGRTQSCPQPLPAPLPAAHHGGGQGCGQQAGNARAVTGGGGRVTGFCPPGGHSRVCQVSSGRTV